MKTVFSKAWAIICLCFAFMLFGCATSSQEGPGSGFRERLSKEYSDLNYDFIDGIYYMKVAISAEDFENYTVEGKMVPYESAIEDAKQLVSWETMESLEWWNPEEEIGNTQLYYYVDDSPFPPYISYAKYQGGYMFFVSKTSQITIKP